MAINLEKYREQIVSAWKEVIDDKSATDWALFSYEGQTNDLKVVSKGDGGIEELRDDLNSGKIMYAFCRVLDPKTSLHKFVLINWTGEGAPNLRKGTCANHIRDVSNVLKGAHVTISARNEEEVDPEVIVEKVSKATGSAYSFKERGETVKASGPVGTTYKRVIPQQEIDSKERDKFWQKEEQEEKKRQEEEKKQKDEERKKLENERQQRELKEAETREARIQERSNSITLQREAERLEKGKAEENVNSEREDDREREDQERKNRSEQLRRQRSQETQALISKRTIDARAVFEQNTSAGQLHQKKSSYQSTPTANTSEKARWPPQAQSVSVQEERIHNNIAQTQPQPLAQTQPQQLAQTQPQQLAQTQPQQLAQTQPQQLAQTQPQQHVQTQPQQLAQTQPQQQHAQTDMKPKSLGEDIIEEVVKSNREEEIFENIDSVHSYTERTADGDAILDAKDNLGLRAQALYDYQAADDTEISFDPGDIITHIDQIDAGWWQGLDPQGNFGLFPANYVQLFE